MGDRGNVVIKDGSSTVYLYTHWNRYRLKQDVASALERGSSRTDDGPYFARIMLCEMLMADGDHTEALQGTTGFGISSVKGDGDETVIIDCANGTVEVPGDYEEPSFKGNFQEYVDWEKSIR